MSRLPHDLPALTGRPETKPAAGMRVQIVAEGHWHGRKGTVTWAGESGTAVDVKLDGGDAVQMSWESCRVLGSANPPAAQRDVLRDDAQAWLDAKTRQNAAHDATQRAAEDMQVANQSLGEAAATMHAYVGVGERRRTVVLGDVVVLVGLTGDGTAYVHECKTE